MTGGWGPFLHRLPQKNRRFLDPLTRPPVSGMQSRLRLFICPTIIYGRIKRVSELIFSREAAGAFCPCLKPGCFVPLLPSRTVEDLRTRPSCCIRRSPRSVRRFSAWRRKLDAHCSNALRDRSNLLPLERRFSVTRERSFV